MGIGLIICSLVFYIPAILALWITSHNKEDEKLTGGGIAVVPAAAYIALIILLVAINSCCQEASEACFSCCTIIFILILGICSLAAAAVLFYDASRYPSSRGVSISCGILLAIAGIIHTFGLGTVCIGKACDKSESVDL